METTGLLALTCLLVVSLTNAQAPAPLPPPACDSTRAQGGYFLYGDDVYNEKYHNCNGGQITTYSCGPDTIWDSEINNCNYANSARQANRMCTASTTQANFYVSGVCYDRGYMCNRTTGLYSVVKCPANTRFNNATGACDNGAGVDDTFCARNNGTGPGECYLYEDNTGDVCKYRVVVNNTLVADNNYCADGTEFVRVNNSYCGCLIANSTTCPRPKPSSLNKMPDLACRASYQLSLMNYTTDGSPRVWSQKIGAWINAGVTSRGVTYGSGIATIGTVLNTQEAGFMYHFHFNFNELTSIPVFQIGVKTTTPSAGPFVLMANNYRGACTPTYSITVTVTTTTTTATATVSGFTRYSSTNITYATVTVPSITLPVSASTNYVDFVLSAGSFPNLQLVDRGVDGNTRGQSVNSTAPASIGASLDKNACGISITGPVTINKFTVYEGCRDVSRVNNA